MQTKNSFIKPKEVLDCPIKSAIHNFLAYILSKKEEIALSYGLKNPVQQLLNLNGIMTEFVYFLSTIKLSHYSFKPQ